jgi:hypothetical protein
MIGERLPRAFPEPVADLWPIVAATFLGRLSAILESVTDLVERGQPADAMVLVRVLYDTRRHSAGSGLIRKRTYLSGAAGMIGG